MVLCRVEVRECQVGVAGYPHLIGLTNYQHKSLLFMTSLSLGSVWWLEGTVMCV